MTPADLKRIRHDYELSVDQMAAVLRLGGKNRARKVRAWEDGTETPTGPVLAIYETLDAPFGDYVGILLHPAKENEE